MAGITQTPPYMFQTMFPSLPGTQQSDLYLQKDPQEEMLQKPNNRYDKYVNNEFEFKQEISRIKTWVIQEKDLVNDIVI